MIPSPLREIVQLERHLERVQIDGDIDLTDIDQLMKSVVSMPDKLNPDLAFRAHEAIVGLHELVQSRMTILRKSLSTLGDGRRALRGYTAIAKKIEHHKVYRNI